MSRSRQDVEARVEGPSRQRDVDGALVGVHRGDQAFRALDARGLEHLLARGVALDVQLLLLVESLEGLLAALDDDVRHVVLLELDHDLGPDASVAANDEVVAKFLQPALHLALSPEDAEAVLGERLGEHAESEQHRTDTEDDQDGREGASGRGLRVKLAVADRADRDDRHVERVEQVPAVDEHVAGDPDHDYDGEQSRRKPEAAERVRDGPPAHIFFWRRFSIRSTARQCAGATHVRVKVAMASAASSGLRCGRTESTERLMPATATGGAEAICRATSPRRASKCSLATTSSTRPASSASAAVSTRAVSSMCRAWPRPTSAASLSEAPHAGMSPSETCVKPMRACSASTRKSQASASSAPPPNASPLTPAITGTFDAAMRSRVDRMRRAIAAASLSERMRSSSLRSPPAQKALSPSPRMTTTRVRCTRAASSASSSSAIVRRASALRAPGRSIEMTATPRSRSSRRSRNLASAAWSLQAWLGHLAEVEHLVERGLRHAAPPRELADRAAGADGFLGDLRGLVVPDDGIQRRREHGAALHELGAAIGRRQALDAALGEVFRGSGQQRDRLEGGHAGHRHHDVELEQAARLAARHDGEVVAVDARDDHRQRLDDHGVHLAGHDAGAPLRLRQPQLAEAGDRTRAHEPDVRADLP